MDGLCGLEFAVLDALTRLQTPWLDATLSAVTRLGNAGFIWIVLAAVLLARHRTRWLGVSVVLALVLDLALCNGILKPLVDRPRPFDLRAASLLIAAPTDASFPSGHTAVSFAATGALFFGRSRLRWPALVLASAIGFSRLYLQVHFPTDVLGGVVVGTCCGVAGALLARRLRRRFAKEC